MAAQFLPSDYPQLIAESAAQILGSQSLSGSFDTVLSQVVSAFPTGGNPPEVRAFIESSIRGVITGGVAKDPEVKSYPTAFAAGRIETDGTITRGMNIESVDHPQTGLYRIRIDLISDSPQASSAQLVALVTATSTGVVVRSSNDVDPDGKLVVVVEASDFLNNPADLRFRFVAFVVK